MMALWIWGGVRPDGEPEPDVFVGVNVFDIFVRNLPRIPIIKENLSFFQRKSQAEKGISGDSPSSAKSSFARAMMGNPTLRRIYEEADPSELSDVWHYALNIKHPDVTRSPDFLLNMQTTVSAVYDDTILDGFVAVYQPLSPLTGTIFRHEYERLFDSSGRKPYVLSDAGPSTAAANTLGESTRWNEDRRLQAVSIEALNNDLLAASGYVDEAVRALYPIVPLLQIEKQHPDEWVALQAVRVDDHGEIVDGRLFASASTRNSLHEQIMAIKQQYPDLVLVTRFLSM